MKKLTKRCGDRRPVYLLASLLALAACSAPAAARENQDASSPKNTGSTMVRFLVDPEYVSHEVLFQNGTRSPRLSAHLDGGLVDISMPKDGGGLAFVMGHAPVATLTVLGADANLGQGGTDVPVTLSYRINNGPWINLNAGNTFQVTEPFTGPRVGIQLGSIPSGQIYFRATTPFVTIDTSPDGMNHGNVVALAPGDSFDNTMAQFANPAPFSPEHEISRFISPYVWAAPPHNIWMSSGSVIVFFELGSTDPDSPSFDLQDMILVITPN